MSIETTEQRKLIAEIKAKLKGKSYVEITDILSTLQYELRSELIY